MKGSGPMTELARPTTGYVHLPYTTDAGIGSKAHIGMVITSNDQTLPYEARNLLNIPGVALYESKVLSTRQRDAEISIEALGRLAEPIVAAVRQINTMHAPDVVAVGCTSGAMAIGPAVLRDKIKTVYPNAQATDPLTGLIQALRTLRARNICFISPYPPAVSEPMIAALRTAGFQVPLVGAFHRDGSNIGADAPFIDPTSIVEAAVQMGHAETVDVVLLACTQLRVAERIEDIEAAIGKPVITSNQAMCWHALRLTGYAQPVEGAGRLFRLDCVRQD
jgi:maleate isomerase